MTDGAQETREPTAFLHGRGPLWENARAGRLDFVKLLLAVLTERGYPVAWRPFSDGIEAEAAADRRHLHVILDDTPMTGDNIVFCTPSYLHGFWYFDPVGTRNTSSMRDRVFRPETMSKGFADRFTDRLRAKFVAGNRSKFEQEMVKGFVPEPGAICIFAQDFREPTTYRHFLSPADMIEGIIANRNGRRVYIKPHPRQSLEEMMTLMEYHAPGRGVEVTNHSIHGLLAQAGAAVSLSSAVLLEAQMHRVPGLVCGEVDFHHNMVSARTPGGISAALHKTLTGRFPYEKYLVFFFAHGMIQPQMQAQAVERICAVLSEMGFPGVA